MTFFEITLYRGEKVIVRRQVTASERTAAIMASRLSNLYGATDVIVEPITDPKKLAAMIARIAVLTVCLAVSAQGILNDQQLRAPRTGSRISRTFRRKTA